MWWVALAAAAVSGLVGVWRARGADARQRAIMLACWRSGLRFSVLNPFPDAMWLPFPMFAPARRPRISNAVWGRRDDDVRAFDLKVDANAAGDEPGLVLTDTLTMSCAVAPLPFSCPRLAVTPRDHTDPSGLPLHGAEVRLELDAFNRRFRVHAVEARAAIAFLDQRMMRALLAMPLPASLHVNEQTLLLTAPRGSAGELLVLFDAARALAKAVPTVTASLYPPRAEEGPHERRWTQGRWSPEPTGSPMPDAS